MFSKQELSGLEKNVNFKQAVRLFLIQKNTNPLYESYFDKMSFDISDLQLRRKGIKEDGPVYGISMRVRVTKPESLRGNLKDLMSPLHKLCLPGVSTEVTCPQGAPLGTKILTHFFALNIDTWKTWLDKELEPLVSSKKSDIDDGMKSSAVAEKAEHKNSEAGTGLCAGAGSYLHF